MILNVEVDDQPFRVEVPQFVVDDGEEFFAKMDTDMASGWQMGRDWIEAPDTKQRCQVAANRLLTAMENNNQRMVWLMAGYILTRMPGVTAVRMYSDDEIGATELVLGGAQ